METKVTKEGAVHYSLSSTQQIRRNREIERRKRLQRIESAILFIGQRLSEEDLKTLQNILRR